MPFPWALAVASRDLSWLLAFEKSRPLRDPWEGQLHLLADRGQRLGGGHPNYVSFGVVRREYLTLFFKAGVSPFEFPRRCFVMAPNGCAFWTHGNSC